ncbi:hypothetical protein ABIE89_008535 [Bradyrhizobium niftali]
MPFIYPGSLAEPLDVVRKNLKLHNVLEFHIGGCKDVGQIGEALDYLRPDIVDADDFAVLVSCSDAGRVKHAAVGDDAQRKRHLPLERVV